MKRAILSVSVAALLAVALGTTGVSVPPGDRERVRERERPGIPPRGEDGLET